MKFIGYHEDEDLPVRPGDLVTIVKGVKIESTHPNGNKVAGRTYQIKVHHILNGGHDKATGDPYTNPAVRWPGTGGYWNHVDINDIPEAQDGKE